MRFRISLSILLSLSFLASCGEEKSGGDGGRSDTASESGSKETGSAGSSTGYRVIDVSNGGTIRGRVLLEGAQPKQTRFEITANQDVCSGAADNDRLQIGSDGGIAWAVIRLVDVKQGKGMSSPSEKETTVDQVGCRYLPHVVAAPLGSRIYFRNSDPTPHNVRVEDRDEKVLMNIAQPEQGEVDTFLVEALGPMSVGCDYHPWMNAYVFGVDNPYYAVTGADGRFEIGGIPPGTYELRMWLNGFEPEPKRDNRGNIVRYGFSEPHEESRSVTVAAGENQEMEFRIKGN